MEPDPHKKGTGRLGRPAEFDATNKRIVYITGGTRSAIVDTVARADRLEPVDGFKEGEPPEAEIGVAASISARAALRHLPEALHSIGSTQGNTGFAGAVQYISRRWRLGEGRIKYAGEWHTWRAKHPPARLRHQQKSPSRATACWRVGMGMGSTVAVLFQSARQHHRC